MYAILKIADELIQQQGEELVDFILSEFEKIVSYTAINDENHRWRTYTIKDPRIRKDCKHLDVTMSEYGPGPEIKITHIFPRLYKGKYYAWWDDGTYEKVFIETSTIEQLEKSLDFQFDQYNKHGEEGNIFLQKLVMECFIKKLSEKIAALQSK